MRILLHIHAYPPKHNCGAEYFAHRINKYLVEQGHEVRVMLGNRPGDEVEYEIDGVIVFGRGNMWGHWFNWAEVVITHLDYTKDTIKTVQYKPIVWYMHNTFDYPTVRSNPRVHVIYNSEAAREQIRYPNPSTFTFTPPVDMPNVCKDPSKNKYVTLINLNESKGGKVLAEIARRMPNVQFMGVIGSYGTQMLEQPPNVTIHPNTANIKEVYNQTKILIMPSDYESWGMTATEAMQNGIPVIANPTFGLKENLGEAGVFVERKNIDGWVESINRLQSKKEYTEASKAARKRGDELRPTKKLIEFEVFLHKIANKPLPQKKEYE